MAPYDPPNTHYAHLDVSSYDRNMILCMIGKGGQGFYKLPCNILRLFISPVILSFCHSLKSNRHIPPTPR